MTAFFLIRLSPIAHTPVVQSPFASAFSDPSGIARRSAAAAIRLASASGELGLFVGMLLAVAVALVVMAGFFV